jgi:hypothetical protein
MGFLKRTWQRAKRGVKRKLNVVHDKSRKFYRGSGLKKAVSYAPLVGAAIGGVASAYTKDPRFAQIGGAIGTAAKDALSGDFKKALEVVEDNISPEAKESVDKIKKQVESVKSDVTEAFNKADNVFEDAEQVGKKVKSGDFGEALQTVEKYMSPEQKQTLDTAIMSGKELKEDAKNLLDNLDDAGTKGPEFFNKLNEKKIQLSDAVTGDSLYVDGVEGLKTKAKNMLEEGKENMMERMKGIKDTMNDLKAADLLPTEIPKEEAENNVPKLKDPDADVQVQSLAELNELVNTDKMESEILNEPQGKGTSFSRILRGEDNDDEED